MTVIVVMFFLLVSNLLAIPRARISAANLDSVALVKRDSLQRIRNVKDSIAFSYLKIPSQKNNPFLDSLIKKTTVSHGDFIAWIDFANSISIKNDISVAQNKFERPSWVVLVIGFILIVLGTVRLFFYSIFQNVVYGLYNDRVLSQISKEDSVLTSWPYIFLYIIFSFSVGLFILLSMSAYQGVNIVTFINFLKISGIVFLLFVGKILFLRFLGLVFELEKIVKEYISVLYLIYFNCLLVSVPLLLILAFSPLIYFKYVLIFFLVIVSILFLCRFFRTGWSLLGNQKFSIFYLILYLCALEIAPILILVKSLNN